VSDWFRTELDWGVPGLPGDDDYEDYEPLFQFVFTVAVIAFAVWLFWPVKS
jgi:hypothetical protein